VGRDAVKKGLELLKESAPLAAPRVAIVTDPSNQAQVAQIPDQDIAARALGLHLYRVEVRAPVDLDRAFATILREHAQALYIYPLRIGPADVERIVQFAIRNRLPTLGAVNSQYRLAGLLFFFSHSTAEHYQRLASYVDKVLNGAKPRDLPVEQPTKFELVINLKTAKALGLTIPQTVLLRADHIIE
jgi:putative ABC transport system substrate-binding protein